MKFFTKPIKRLLRVPIYNATVWLVIADDIIAERKKFDREFGAGEDYHCRAMCCYSPSNGCFALMFDRNQLTAEVLAHEIFHLTHRILEWSDSHFDKDHHEQGCLLCGFLTEWVIKQIKY
jgi:hypothetical protein